MDKRRCITGRGRCDYNKIIKLATETVKALRNLNNNPDKKRCGGYLTILNCTNGQLLLQVLIGTIPVKAKDPDYATKAGKYQALSLEKAERLRAMHCRSRHISSWQSRNLTERKYGGAVAVGNLIISFSGLSEHADEAVSLVLAKELGGADSFAIADISQNPFWPDMSNWWEEKDRWQ